MDSSQHFTRSKARRKSISQDILSDVEPDDVAPETENSGIVRLQVKAARGPESLLLQLAGPPSAPTPAEGGSGDRSFGLLLAVASVGASGSRMDPVDPHQEGRMSFQLSLEFATRQLSLVQHSPTVASPVVRRRTPPLVSESVRRRPPTRATYTQKPYNSRRVFKLGGRVGHVSRHLRQLFKVKRSNVKVTRSRTKKNYVGDTRE